MCWKCCNLLSSSFFCGYCMMLQCTVYTALNFADNVWLFKVKKNLNKWTLFVMHCPKNILEQMQRYTVGMYIYNTLVYLVSEPDILVHIQFYTYVNKSSCICSSRDRPACMQRFRFILGQCDRIACTSYTLNIFPWKLNNLHGWKYEMLSNYILKSHSPSKFRKFSCTVHEQQGYEFSFYSSPHLAFFKLC